MKKYLLLIVLPCLLISCKSKKPSFTGTEKVDVQDFVDFFQPLKLPIQFSDSILIRREPDSFRIGHAVFIQFIPDSVLTNQFGKGIKPKIYPVGKAAVPKNETYFFIKAVAAAKKVLYVVCFDKTNHFVVAKPLIVSAGDSHSSTLALMDGKYTLTITRQRKTDEGQVFYKKDAYVFNDAGIFTLILTESNEPVSQRNLQIINPIDTLSHKHKYTGDYAQDKRNFIAVRDGKDPNHIFVFVHFEKDKGECKGELKGAATFISPTVARYKTNGDPCELELTFSPEKVSIKEIEACGNHRDIKCFFDGSYLKKKEIKKETKAKPVKKKTAKNA